MSNEIEESLVVWACPTIASPAESKGSNPLRQLPFPAIDLSSEGFTYSQFPWVGINVARRQRRKHLIKLAMLHEDCHRALARTPFLLYIKELLLRLYLRLEETIKEGGERIEVPLKTAKSGNPLKEHWELTVRFKRRSRLVEEIFAIRSSLLVATKLGIIEEGLALKILPYYKIEYGKLLPFFPEIYDAYDLVARKIGRIASTTMVFTVLETFNPYLAFLDLRLGMCKIKSATSRLWLLSDEQTDWIANLSFEEAIAFFRAGIDVLDPDDTIYRRKEMLNIKEMIEQRWGDIVQDDYDEEDDFFNFFFDPSPTGFLYSEYDDTGHTFIKLEGSPEVIPGEHYILLEAILQQLTTGKGLLCPFWKESAPNCCYDANRAFLENVWSCTSHNRSCNWKRMGCLASEGNIQFSYRRDGGEH